MDRLGDDARRHVLVERQGLLEHRVRRGERVFALGDADAAEVLAPRAVGAHVVRGDEGEHRVRPARAIRIGRVAREQAEAAERLAERLDVVGVARDAGDDLGVARLDGARGAAHRHHAGGAAQRQVVEPARGEAEVLRQAHRRVGRQREARHAQAVDVVLGDARLAHQFGQHPADEPVRAMRRVAHIGHGDRHGHGDAFITFARGECHAQGFSSWSSVSTA